jgi:D-alanyl-lipoteichoic acid acyltransferase DltB (MBOAT superfamily)
MSLISVSFFIFICVLLIVYYTVPEGHQWKVLLAASAIFYIAANPVYIIFITISIVSTWYLMRDPVKSHLIWTIVINLGLLVVFKYSVNFGIHDLIVPLGISYYTFMTLGYALDCYYRKITPCDNLSHYALFIGYFPQLTQGPIGTYGEMHDQLISSHKFDTGNIKKGAYRVITGCFKKLVIAGRLAYYVDTVFASPKTYGGLTLIVAVFFYLMELYADFSGYMDIVCGISQMLGIRLKENFLRPYLSKNVPEFWRRWHISLMDWFNAHVFMPAVTSGWNRKLSKFLAKVFPKAKKGTLRTIFPMILVWFITGLWHGAKASYIAWGGYYAVVMLLSFCTASYVKRLCEVIRWNKDNPFIKVFRTLRTFTIVATGEIIYRADSIEDITDFFTNIITKTRISGAAAAAALEPFGNGNQAVASIMIIGVILLAQFIVELAKEKDETAFTKHRYAYALIMLVVTVLFGTVGKSNFMYQAF